MTSPHDEPTLDDVIEPTETPHRDRSEHGGYEPRADDEHLEERTEHERAEVAEDRAAEE